MATESKFRLRTLFFASLLGVLFSFVLIEATSLHPRDFRVARDDGHEMGLRLPFVADSEGGTRNYVASMRLEVGPLAQTGMRVVLDDCLLALRVNGANIPINGIPAWQRCDVYGGFDLDLRPYLKSGSNQVEFAFVDRGGKFKFHVARAFIDRNARIMGILFALFIAASVVCAALLAKIEPATTFLMAGGMLIRVFYLLYTPYTVRSHDAPDHLEYIQWIAEKLSLPSGQACVECHQSPLYYAGAGAIYRGLQWLAPFDLMLALQLFSLGLYAVFMYYGVLTLKTVVRDRRVLYPALALFVFWPTGVFHSIRIGNDVPFYMFCVIALHGTYVYWLGGEGARITRPIFFGFLALLTKVTGIINLGVTSLCFLVRLARTKAPKELIRRNATGLAVLALGLVAFAALTIYRQKIGAGNMQSFNNFDRLRKDLIVGNTWRNYLWFDLPTFLAKPFVSTLDDATGRQYFWNFLLKSSLTGEFRMQGATMAWLARAIGVVSLGLLGGAALGAWSALRNRNSVHLVSGFTLTLFLLAVLVYRMLFPAACNNDFRFIYPAVVPLCLFYAEGLSFARARNGSPFLGRVLSGLAWVFSGLVILFFILPVLWLG